MSTNCWFESLVEAIGHDRAVELTKAIGGIRIWIPRGTTPAILIEILGESIAGKLVDHFKSGRLDIPKADFVVRKLRNDRICQDFYRGATLRELALEHRLNERTIGIILEKDRNEQQQSPKRGIPDSDRPTG